MLRAGRNVTKPDNVRPTKLEKNVSENNEEPNDFKPDPAIKTAAEETAPKPSEVHDAVRQALAQQGVKQIKLAPCPCGVTAVNLMIDIPQGNKIGRSTCGACGVWGVDFLAPRTQDQELIGTAAAKAWNEAPRIIATDPA
jgi:hypothetical protein